MEDKNKGHKLEVLNQLAKGNHFVLYIYRKISRISQAVYIITDTVKDLEPLKWTLRKISTEGASFKHFLDEHTVFNTLENLLFELEGMLELGSNSGVISQMNAAIIQDQIRKLIGEMKEGSSGQAYLAKFDQGFFEIPKPLMPPTSYEFQREVKKEDQYKSHKGHNVLYDFYTPPPAKSGPMQQLKSDSGGKEDKGQRQEKMLKIIRSMGEVTIKDITEQIKDCSEKTIQRELTLMVLQGILKKTGERRWSRYSVLK